MSNLTLNFCIFSAPPTPRAGLSRRNSCSTFSVHMGLASMLNERGIKAVTPSALNTPSGVNYSPTVTPCNSPEGRPSSPEPQTLANLLTSGADLLRKKFSGLENVEPPQTTNQRPSRLPAKNKALTHLERRALRQIKIMDKVESLGLENIIPSTNASNISPLALHGTSAFIRRTASPMTQLTSLKHLNEGRNNRSKSDDSMSGSSSISTTSSLMPDSVDSASSDISSSSAATNQQTTPSRPTRGRPVSEARLKQMQRQRSRRNMLSGNGASAAQRPDLGTVHNSSSRPASGIRPDLGAVSKHTSSSSPKTPEQKPEEKALGFVGTISSLLFGRKGGLL